MTRDRKTNDHERVIFDPQASDSDLVDALNVLRVSRGLKPLTLVDDFILGEIWEREQHALGKTLYTDEQPVNTFPADFAE